MPCLKVSDMRVYIYLDWGSDNHSYFRRNVKNLNDFVEQSNVVKAFGVRFVSLLNWMECKYFALFFLSVFFILFGFRFLFRRWLQCTSKGISHYWPQKSSSLPAGQMLTIYCHVSHNRSKDRNGDREIKLENAKWN